MRLPEFYFGLKKQYIMEGDLELLMLLPDFELMIFLLSFPTAEIIGMCHYVQVRQC